MEALPEATHVRASVGRDRVDIRRFKPVIGEDFLQPADEIVRALRPASAGTGVVG